MPTKARAATILVAFNQAQAELLGKAVIFTDGKAGTVDNIWFDETHELRISIRGHEGRWPISTIKLAQADPVRDNALNGGSTWCFGKTTSVSIPFFSSSLLPIPKLKSPEKDHFCGEVIVSGHFIPGRYHQSDLV